jgi:hypothetical protein
MRVAVIFIALSLTGCASWFPNRHSVLPPTPAHIPDSLKKPCDRLITIPDRDLTQEEATALWAAERKAHGACIRKDDKLIKAADALEKQGRKQ